MIIHQNQYGFIKGENVQDCLGYTFEYLHKCHKSKRPIIILKLDSEKAFDKIEYSAVIEMLRAKGFVPRWINWVTRILNSASTSMLLNGVAGEKIMCKRGVRQGDPISPLLYVLTADLLQTIVNLAWMNGELTLPVEDSYG